MSKLGITAFDRTLEKTEAWLRDLGAELQWSDAQKSYLALRVTLHALRDRLPVSEAVQLGAQLPMLLRGVYYDGWKPLQTPDKSLDKQGFLLALEEAFRDDPDFDAGRVCGAVFGTVRKHISEGESADIGSVLPKGLRELWAEAQQD